MNESEFTDNLYDTIPETKFFEYDQVQIMRMKNSSETEWTLSNDYKNKYNMLVHRAATGD